MSGLGELTGFSGHQEAVGGGCGAVGRGKYEMVRYMGREQRRGGGGAAMAVR